MAPTTKAFAPTSCLALALALHACATLLLQHAAAVRVPAYGHAAGARAGVDVTKDTTSPSPYSYTTHFYTQTLDHFDFGNSTATYQQRYLLADQWWDGKGPIFFYTGNEGPIDLFANNTGFMWDIAPEYKALLVFAEHRYYGTSMPYGNDTYKNPKTSGHLRFLTSEQALADYATLIPVIKSKMAVEDVPVIAFGGSYGGMLSAWIRIRYPWIIDGSIAASAPILQYTGITPPQAYSAVLSNTYRTTSADCATGIEKAWAIMEDMPLSDLSEAWSLCTPLKKASDVTGALFNFINGAIQYMAMADYPYPATFLGPMPAWPVKAGCSVFKPGMSNADTIKAVRYLTNVFYNYTGQMGKCFVIDQNGPSTLQDAGGWNYQSCTEQVMPIGQYGPPNDILWPAPWNLTAIIEGCNSTYGVLPRPNWIQTSFGGNELQTASNIVFSQGSLDPWSGGGVTHNVSDTVHAVIIEDGAHHLDLRASNPADPDSVIWARNFHRMQISKWVAEAGENKAAAKLWR